ncbi:MAG: hypothetical protein H7A33_02425 [Deltaproteobacteria bacterium]|nr:hypothetical protein [Deltaproteobacteria bacterium]
MSPKLTTPSLSPVVANHATSTGSDTQTQGVATSPSAGVAASGAVDTSTVVQGSELSLSRLVNPNRFFNYPKWVAVSPGRKEEVSCHGTSTLPKMKKYVSDKQKQARIMQKILRQCADNIQTHQDDLVPGDDLEKFLQKMHPLVFANLPNLFDELAVQE